jgi:hypothetical protein
MQEIATKKQIIFIISFLRLYVAESSPVDVRDNCHYADDDEINTH